MGSSDWKPKSRKWIAGGHVSDGDKKAELPVHIILGVSDNTKIRTEMRPKIGFLGESVVELTQFGWTIMSSGKEIDISSMLLTQTAAADCEALCKLNVLGDTKQRTSNRPVR